ncbi:MAG: hypothetical protein IJL07_10265 [Lachnospiraceae bacterium]|nr:hypothetical protein [Lachnospiraceae bacterium]
MALLDDKLREYQKILEKKEELAEETKRNNEAKETLEQEICQIMIDEEKPSQIVDGYNFSLKQETVYSKLGEEKLLEKQIDFFELLREQGLGDIIVERVDPRTLNSTCKGIVEEQGELPEELAEALSVYEKLGLSRRKANTVALDRAKANKEA